MRRGTTPTLIFNVDMDLTSAEELFITFRQDDRTIVEKTKDECVVETDKITMYLTQEDTLAFSSASRIRVQIRARFDNGDAFASNIVDVRTREILKEGVI